MSLYRDIKMILLLRCRESSRLLSEGLERPLSRGERMALRAHLFVCHRCRRCRRSLQHLRSLSEHLADPGAAGQDALPPLSSEARARIAEAVTRAATGRS